MFGTSGIRGIYGKEVTEELALKIGHIFADGKVVVSRDTRKTGISLVNALKSGIISKGMSVVDLGIVPTPTLAFATQEYRCRGVMITASHNPPEYNGLKLFENGKEISREEEKKVEQLFSENPTYVEWNSVGKVIEEKDAIEKHKEFIKRLVDGKLIAKRKLKVVVDSNGAAAVISPGLMRELGCEVISINDKLDGFSRPSEPNHANLSELMKKVKDEKADLGIGHDGDGDRAIIIDEKGEMLGLDVQLAIMIEHELKASKNKNIVSTVEASLMIRETVEKNRGKIEITPVGSLYVAEALDKKGAVFGGEPCGEYIFSKGTHCPDGMLVAAKFLEIASWGKLSVLKSGFNTYPILREKFKCKNKHDVMEKLKENIGTAEQVSYADGIRIDEENGWILVRASGTEPIIRLTMEYKDRKELDEKAERMRKLILHVIGEKQ